MVNRPPVAVYDACVLYPFHLRNVLVRCAVDRLVAARWSDDIRDEWIRNLAADHSGLTVDRLRRTRDLMKAVLPDADVRNHHALVDRIHLPDADDRHVVAAAIAGGASIIVTWNAGDFPDTTLAGHGLLRKDPDTFLCEVLASAPRALADSVERARLNRRHSAPSARSLSGNTRTSGLADVRRTAP